MNRFTLHVTLPACALVAFLASATMPVEVLGCRNRGLVAVVILLLSLFGALGTAVVALRERIRGTPKSFWWAVTSLVLTLPAVVFLLV